MSGWIKLHRGINNHWIWDNSDYLKWWIDILLEANHTPAKVLIKGKVYDCNRGEKLYSLDTWAKRWNTNKSKVRRFLELLQKDAMIELKSETQTTRLTICNYDSYQETKTEIETQTKRKRNTSETQTTPIQERKEEIEENIDTAMPFSFYNSLINLGAKKELVSDWLKVRKNKNLTNTQTAFNKFVSQYNKSGYTINEVLEKCVEKSWGGFDSDWFSKVKKQNTRIPLKF
jgi:DNA-binding transcriptional regulator YhcF (GntR family)